MSAQVWALVGILLGALLAGGASLLLAWRQETVEAQAGAQVVRDLLKRAERALHAILALESRSDVQMEWWRPGGMPTSEPWRAYQRALISRLPRGTLATIEGAMARLDALNMIAAQANERHDQATLRIYDAIVQIGSVDEQALPRAKDVLTQLTAKATEESWLGIGNDERDLLRKSCEQFRAVRANLGDDSPAFEPEPNATEQTDDQSIEREETKGEGTIRRSPLLLWAQFHLRPLIAATVLAAAVVIVLLTVVSAPESATDRMEGLLAAHVHGEALTSCEPVKDRESRFDCVVTMQANGQACPTGSASAGWLPVALVGVAQAASGSACGSGNTAVTAALEFLGISGKGQKCALMAEVRAARPPSKRKSVKKPGSDPAPSTSGAGELPQTLMPGQTFVACAR